METNAQKLKQLDDFLEGKNFFVGDSATVADFAMYHPVWWHMEVAKEAEQEWKYSNIKVNRVVESQYYKKILCSSGKMK